MGYYKRQPVVVQAKSYELGLEDGFINTWEAIRKGVDLTKYNQPECCKVQGIPYINTSEGVQYIQENDMIIQGVNGTVFCMRKETFDKMYEEVVCTEGAV